MERHYQPWTKKENDYLEANYKNPLMEVEEMAKHLHRSTHSIIARAFVKGYKRPPRVFREIMNNKKMEV